MVAKKSKSRVNEAGNYTKPAMRKRMFNEIKAGGKGGRPGQWSARKAQMLAKRYKAAGGGYKNEWLKSIFEMANRITASFTKCQMGRSILELLIQHQASVFTITVA